VGLRTTLRRRLGRRSQTDLSFQDWVNYFAFAGNQYPLLQLSMGGEPVEEPSHTFQGYVQAAYRSNGIVFACMLVRMLLFAEARFQFRELRNGRPGDLFGTAALAPLERPWPGGTTGDLLSRMIQDADLAGNFYGTLRAGGLRRLRPDWVSIVLGSRSHPDDPGCAIDADVVAYGYWPGGPAHGDEPEILLPETVCHFAPIPDPLARFRGMSWLTPVIREVMGDQAASQHKLRYFEKGATGNYAVTVDKAVSGDKFKEFVRLFKEEHADLVDAYKVIFLGGGADAKLLGSDLKQADFKTVQGAGETRIAAAAGVPPVIAGFSEGLEAATYSNYGQARRRFADGTMRPLWRNAAGSLARIITVPASSELWYDDRDIPFLQEDQKDAADILEVQSRAIKGLVEAGFHPDAAVEAVAAGDLRRLEHTGLLSVQMQKPGDGQTANGAAKAPAASG